MPEKDLEPNADKEETSVAPEPEETQDDSDVTESDEDQDDSELAEAFEDKDNDNDNDADEQESEEQTEDESDEKSDTTSNKKPNVFKRFWAHKKLRYSVIIAILAVTGLMIFVPSARFATLGALGFRGTVIVTVKDAETSQPLKDVKVSINGQDSSTNEEGLATINEVKLGNHNLEVSKTAYATSSQTLTVSVGDTRPDEVLLAPTGTPFTFNVTDWISDAAIVKAEVSYQDSSAFSDEDGQVRLTVPPLNESEFIVSIKAEGFKPAEAKIQASVVEPTSVKLVPVGKRVFISKRGGVYDLYKSDLDGKREQKLVAGTGKERDELALSVNYKANRAILVSSREGKRNTNGELMDGIFSVDLKSGELTKIAEAYRIQLIGWVGDAVVYTKYSYLAPVNKQYVISSYNVSDGATANIANASGFSDILTTDSYVFYIPVSYSTPAIKPYLYRKDVNGTNRTIIRASETWSVLRQGSNSLIISAPDNTWLEADLTGANLLTLDGPPARAYRSVSHLYVANPDSNESLWVDQRDGKGVLLLHKPGTPDSSDKALVRQSGLRTPVAWVDNTRVIFRVNTDQETADYIVSINGGEAKKISDVSDVGSEDRYHYYY